MQKIREAVKSHLKNTLLRKTPLKPTRPAREGSEPVFKVLQLGYNNEQKTEENSDRDPQWIKDLHFIKLRQKRSSMRRNAEEAFARSDKSVQTLFEEVEKLRQLMIEINEMKANFQAENQTRSKFSEQQVQECE